MTAIAAVLGTLAEAGRVTGEVVRAMGPRGGTAPVVAAIGAARRTGALGVSRADWEAAAGARGSGMATRDDVTVVADAALYYEQDLRAAIASAGVVVRGTDAAGLIADAYLAFGDDCARRLEGDFAFILWDARRARLVAARDFAGKRTLYHGLHDGTLVVASTAGGVLALPGFPRRVDVATLATVAGGVWTHTDECAWQGVREVRAGWTLTAEDATTAPTLREHWQAPAEILRTRQPLDAAALELRELLVRAVAERLAGDGVTALSLSGGWDSTAVYGAGQEALRRDAATARVARSLAPVSISYPPGDPGREDELIEAVVRHWGGDTRFIDVDGIAMFEDAAARAARRDHPMAHTYEQWNRALARGARARGARVMLDGIGGDQLFQVSDIVLADLFRGGRWLELARQYRHRAQGRGDLRALYHWAVRPALPATVTRALARMRRRPPAPHYLERRVPFWFRDDFVRAHDLEGRERRHRPGLPTHSAVLAEAHAFLRFPFYARIVGLLHGFAHEEGVELRSPLLDERVVRFAMRRPWSERADRGETKVLLRRAMRGLLPEHVLAPRTHRTGVTSAYFLRQVRGAARPLIEGSLLADSRLATLGMIDPARVRRAWEHVQRHDDDEVAGRLFFTLQAELWLRGQGAA